MSRITSLGSLMILGALLPTAASATSATSAAAEQELDEITVQGNRIKANRDPVQILAWLRRLLGKYSYEGYVELGEESPKVRRVASIVLAICATLLISAAASAEPRGASTAREPLTPEQAEAKRFQTVSEMETWLQRLTGRFRYMGAVEIPTALCIEYKKQHTTKCWPGKPRDAEGMWDCVNIGKGSGVHCVIGSTAQRRIPTVPNLDGPKMILFGIDPDIPALRYMQLDEDGVATEYLGHLSGDEVTFHSPCIPPGNACLITITITAPSEGTPIYWAFDRSQFTLSEYRTTQRLTFRLFPLKRDQVDKIAEPTPGK